MVLCPSEDHLLLRSLRYAGDQKAISMAQTLGNVSALQACSCAQSDSPAAAAAEENGS